MVKGLKNKVVLVTGAAQGIGRGIALRLVQEGAHIFNGRRNSLSLKTTS